MERKCFAYIKPCMKAHSQASAKQAKEAWDILQIYFQGMDKVKTSKLQILRRYIETLSIKDTYSVDSIYTHIIGMINQIKSHVETIEDIKVVEKVLFLNLILLL
jgi:hypothetical protein